MRSELTPDDVTFSFQRIRDPATAATNAARLADITSIVAGDHNVVRFKLKQPNATLLLVLADNSSLVVSRKWMQSGVDPKATMMGSGPFQFVDRQPGVAVNLKRNEHYFVANLPYLEGITYQPMADDNSRVTALRSGSVDFVDYLPYTQMDVIQKSGDLVFKSDKVLGFGWLAFVADKQPVSDLRVRQAFALGMDRDKLAETAFSGHGEAISGGLIPPGWTGYSPDLAGTSKADPEKAKSLLQQAGQSPLAIDLLTRSTYSVIARPAEAAQAELKKVNINGNLVEQEWLTFRQTVADGTYAVHVWGTAPTFNDPDFLSEYVGSNGFFAKQIHFKDDQLDQLLVKGRQTIDPTQRNQIWLGLVAGFYRGWVESAIMRAMDLVLSFPTIILAIAIVAMLGASIGNLIAVIAIVYIPRFVRIVYGATLSVRETEYVQAAKVAGATDWRILRLSVLANVTTPILVQISLSLGFAILVETGLSFLGLGAQPPVPSLGNMVSAARPFMEANPWLLLAPAAAVGLTVLALNTLGDGVRDLLDPRLNS